MPADWMQCLYILNIVLHYVNLAGCGKILVSSSGFVWFHDNMDACCVGLYL